MKIFTGSVNGGGFRLFIAAFPSGAEGESSVYTDSMTPNCWIIEYVIGGRGVLDMPPFLHTPGAGDLYILPKRGQSYSFHSDPKDPWAKACILVDGPLVERLIDAYGLTGKYLFRDCGGVFDIFQKIYSLKNTRIESQFEALPLFCSLLDRLRGHELMAESGRGGSDRREDLPARLRGYLDDGVESDVSVETFCMLNKANKSSLIRRFRQRYGCPPYAYLMSCRVSQAQALLKFSDMSVKEIAARLKFTDQYHFSNYFKKKTGVSPSTYRSR